MITVAFAGHRDVFQAGVKERLTDLLEELAAKYDALTFYTGGMGEFDSLASACVRGLKHRHPKRDIRLVLVEPYMKQSINTEGEYLKMLYDEILIPAELAGIHYKKAITERNRWMVREADLLISYVYRDFGGAAAAVKYAKKLWKVSINVAEAVNDVPQISITEIVITDLLN